MSRRTLLRLLVLCVAVVGGLAAAECGLRVAGLSYPTLWETDDDLGGWFRPGAESWWTMEGRDYVRINSQGLRDREHEVAKPPGTFRIAAVGDSYTEALQLPMEQAWWSVMADRLQSCPALAGQKVEVVNFGHSGLGTGMELEVLRHKVWPYSPDLVVMAFCTANDVADNSQALSHDYPAHGPYFSLRGDEVVRDMGFRDSPEFRRRHKWYYRVYSWLRVHSRILQMATRIKSVSERPREHFEELRPALVHDLENPVLQDTDGPGGRPGGRPGDRPGGKPENTEMRDAWRLSERLLEQTRDEVAAHHARFLLATISMSVQVSPDPDALVALKPDLQRLQVDDLFYPDHRLQRFGDRAGIPTLTLGEPLRAWALQHHTYLHGYPNLLVGWGHWNSEGHRLGGELIAERVCANLAKEKAGNMPGKTQGAPDGSTGVKTP